MKLISLIFVIYLAFSHPVNAAPRIASIKPLLEQAIGKLDDYEIIYIHMKEQNAATPIDGMTCHR